MKIEKVEKIVANFHHKQQYVIHIKNLKTSVKPWNSIEQNA